MENNIIPLTDAIQFVNSAVTNKQVHISLVSDAPKWLKLLFGNDYFAYKNTIYTPVDHLVLIAPESNPLSSQLLINPANRESLRTVATANLFPWMLAIKDGRTTKFSDLLRLRFGYKLASHYFLYKYLFLKASESPYLESVLGGFLCTRKRFLRKVSPEKVSTLLNNILSSSAQSLTKNPTQ